MESTWWKLLEDNTLVDVTSGNAFVMRLPDGTTMRVRVANIDDSASKDQLRALLRGRKIEVWVVPALRYDRSVEGQVRAGTVDVANAMLALGEARYVDATPYTISSYYACLNRIAEREAKAAHRGLWAY